MLVGERMSKPVITISPDAGLPDALETMKREKIRRLPVVRNGKLVGIITSSDLQNASPSAATSLSIWELNYLLSKIKVDDIMTKKVVTVSVDTPIEEAARIMADSKLGGLPVMRAGELAGMITETDLFKIFLELMGARSQGVRVTATLPEQRGKLAELSQAVSAAGGNFVAFGVFSGSDISNRTVTFKVEGLDKDYVRQLIEPIISELIDIR